jgi:hypothetical protein
MSFPAFFQTFFGNNGKTFTKTIELVDGSGMMVNPAFALEAVPVKAEPVDVQVEGDGGSLPGYDPGTT